MGAATTTPMDTLTVAAATVAEVTEMETPTDTKVVEAEEATEEARAADTEEDAEDTAADVEGEVSPLPILRPSVEADVGKSRITLEWFDPSSPMIVEHNIDSRIIGYSSRAINLATAFHRSFWRYLVSGGF